MKNTPIGHSHLERLVDTIWQKIISRFPNINAAFRFFDENLDQGISFFEFVQALEYLRLKFSYEDIREVFNYLDFDNNGAIGYAEFCMLCPDRATGDIRATRPKLSERTERSQPPLQTMAKLEEEMASRNLG